MTYVMVCQGWADGSPCADAGFYLESFDFEADDGLGLATFTRDLTRAKRFADMSSAMAYWRTVSHNRPTREDGKPNRPFTAWTVSITEIEDKDAHDLRPLENDRPARPGARGRP